MLQIAGKCIFQLELRILVRRLILLETSTTTLKNEKYFSNEKRLIQAINMVKTMESNLYYVIYGCTTIVITT